jgi:hypothetical protein
MAPAKKQETAKRVEWVAAIAGAIPANSLVAGSRGNRRIYVCRARQGSSVYLGELRAGTTGCRISLRGQELVLPAYEVLVSRADSITPGRPTCGDAAVRIYALADVLFSDDYASVFLSDSEKVTTHKEAIGIRSIALKCRCSNLVDEAEGLKELATESLPSRRDAKTRLDRMKEIVRACIDDKS